MKKTIAAAALALVATAPAYADQFEVRITNITLGQIFTPVLVAAHSADISLYELGAPASDELALLAEGGDTAPLEGVLSSVPDLVSGFGNAGDLLMPGMSVSVIVDGGGRFNLISLAGMLLPTNDSFVGADSLRAPRAVGASRQYFAVAYDAGSELNDENCANIPGPQCGGEGASPNEGGEGYVHVSRGIAGSDTVPAAAYDWRNPVAQITITRVE